MKFHSNALLEHCYTIEKVHGLGYIDLYSEKTAQKFDITAANRDAIQHDWDEFVKITKGKNEQAKDCTNLLTCSLMLDYPFAMFRVQDMVVYNCISLNVSLIAPVFTIYHTYRCAGKSPSAGGFSSYLVSKKDFDMFHKVKSNIAQALEDDAIRILRYDKISHHELSCDALFKDQNDAVIAGKVFDLYFGYLF
jgi:hypothetical protein